MEQLGRGARVWIKGTVGPRVRITAVDLVIREATVSWRWNGRLRDATYGLEFLTRTEPNADSHLQRTAPPNGNL